MREAWNREAPNWLRLARAGLDAGWDVLRPPFLRLLPPPGRLRLDIGCGEGRLGRALQEAGHRVVGVDITYSMARAAASHEDPLIVVVGDGARLPVQDRAVDLVVAYMCLMDMDDFAGAIQEAARVLQPGGRFCLAIVHPIYTAGRFLEDGTFLLDRSYLGIWRYPSSIERRGIETTFHSEHRPISAYTGALEEAGFVIESLQEPIPEEPIASLPGEERWRRIPNFLMIRAALNASF